MFWAHTSYDINNLINWKAERSVLMEKVMDFFLKKVTI